MKNLIKMAFLILAFITLFQSSACLEISPFEGLYVGTYKILYIDGSNLPLEGGASVIIRRSFKDISNEYIFAGNPTLTGEIKQNGDFEVSREGTSNNGSLIRDVDTGKIYYDQGQYLSTYIQTVDGVEILRVEFNLQKQFVDIE